MSIKISRIIESLWLMRIFLGSGILILFNTISVIIWNIGIKELVDPFRSESFIYNLLSLKEGTLTTISAIFIGIYFTVYTILGTVKLESSFAVIDKESFDKVRHYLKMAFVGSFSFLFIVLFLPMFNLNIVIPIIYQIIFLSLIYMLLTAFRLNFILFYIFEHDFSTLHSKLQEDEEEKRENKEIIFRMSAFLDDYESKKDEEQAANTRDYLYSLQKKNKDTNL